MKKQEELEIKCELVKGQQRGVIRFSRKVDAVSLNIEELKHWRKQLHKLERAMYREKRLKNVGRVINTRK